MVTQDVQLFQASVRDNLTLFDDSICRMSASSQCYEDSGPESLVPSAAERAGYDAGSRGGAGSRRARRSCWLSCAYSWLTPVLVILDEASSRLDPATERLIERAVEKLSARRPDAGARQSSSHIGWRQFTALTK